jgi:hypothetical protein
VTEDWRHWYEVNPWQHRGTAVAKRPTKANRVPAIVPGPATSRRAPSPAP